MYFSLQKKSYDVPYNPDLWDIILGRETEPLSPYFFFQDSITFNVPRLGYFVVLKVVLPGS